MDRQLNPTEWQPIIKQALQTLRKPTNAATRLTELYLFSQALQTTSGNQAQAIMAVLRQALAVMAESDSQSSKLLERQFFDGQPAKAVAADFYITESTYFRHQEAALATLTTTLLALENAAYTQQRNTMLARLEAATYQQLVAGAAHLAEPAAKVAPTSPHYLIALTGIGGIGKTSLADALLRQVFDQGTWHHIAWLTARQQTFNAGGGIRVNPQPVLTTEAFLQQLYGQISGQSAAALTPDTLLSRLTTQLQLAPHLIVVDNLETVADLETLLPTLRRLSNPSKFLLTTRESLFAEADIAHLPVPELSAPDALQLVRREARARNLPQVLAAPDEELQPIYTTVGGNPLALRLVVGQLHTFALRDVLDDLVAKQGIRINNLYRYIYEKAWTSLAEAARQTLLAMLLAPESGAEFGYLTHVNPALTPGALRSALDQLVTISLVDRRGDLNSARYTIHNLTRTFLHEVVEW